MGELQESMDLLKWGTESQSFDDMDIRLTRPGFGVIVLLKPDNVIQNLRKSVENLLLLRTRDDCLHMTVFQVFLTFREDYDPFSLPNNLLEAIHNYMFKAIQTDLVEMAEDLGKLCVQVTDNWLILGKDFPSHLVVEVTCKEVCHVLQNFKEKVNKLGYQWMKHLAEELGKRNFKNQLVQGQIGSKLSSNGWDLIIGYTSNPDYKTHVTMGILPTTDSDLNEALLGLHEDVNREIAVKFSSEEGDPDIDTMLRSMKNMITSYRVHELRKLNEDDDQISKYPTLRAEILNAKTGRAVELSKNLIDEWGKVKMKTIQEKLSKVPQKQKCFKISKIQLGIINMERMQNFEPPPVRTCTGQYCTGILNLESVQEMESRPSTSGKSGEPWIGELKAAHRA